LISFQAVIPDGYQLIDREADIFYQDILIAKYVPRPFFLPSSPSDLNKLSSQLVKVHTEKIGNPHSRGKAAGGQKKKIKTQSYSVGYLFSSYENLVQRVSWNIKHQQFCQTHLQPLIEKMWEAHKFYMPKAAEAQLQFLQLNRPQVQLYGTGFTAVDMNFSFATRVHKDVKDLQEGYSLLYLLHHKTVVGGYFLLPEFKIAIKIRQGGILWMQAWRWFHCNSSIFSENSTSFRLAQRMSLRGSNHCDTQYTHCPIKRCLSSGVHVVHTRESQ